MPFVEPLTTRACSHTFCRECITTALYLSQHCPIDRSPLTLDDLIPADPLLRNVSDIPQDTRLRANHHHTFSLLMNYRSNARCEAKAAPLSARGSF